jgi:hypothetical protein
VNPASSTAVGPQHDAGGLLDRPGGAVGGDHPRHRERQLAQPLAGGGRHDEHLEAARLEVGLHQLGEVARVRHVDLVEHDRPRPAGEPRGVVLVERQLALDDVEVG